MSATSVGVDALPKLLEMEPEAMTRIVEGLSVASRKALDTAVEACGQNRHPSIQYLLVGLACRAPGNLPWGNETALLAHWPLALRITEKRETTWKRALVRAMQQGPPRYGLPPGTQIMHARLLLAVAWSFAEADGEPLTPTQELLDRLRWTLNDLTTDEASIWLNSAPGMLRAFFRAGPRAASTLLRAPWRSGDPPTNACRAVERALADGLLAPEDLLTGAGAGHRLAPAEKLSPDALPALEALVPVALLPSHAGVLAHLAADGGAAGEWALRALTASRESADFDVSGFADAVARRVGDTSQKSALALVQRAVVQARRSRTEPNAEVDALARALQAALRHGAPAVRTAASRGLDAIGRPADPPLPVEPSADTSDASAEGATPLPTAESLAARFAAVPPALARLVGLPTVFDAPLPPPTFGGHDFPRLTTPIAAIADFDELLDVGLGQLTRGGDAAGFERMMDAMGRLAGTLDEVSPRRLGGLRAALRRGPSGFSEQLDLLPALAAQLFNAWLDRTAPTGPSHQPIPILQLVSDRAAILASFLARRETHRLLATPTHAGGFIDPRVLVERVDALKGIHPNADVTQAFLRVAPEGRTSARSGLASHRGTIRPALDFVLGGPEPAAVDPSQGEVWATAARARNPDAHWAVLASLPYAALPDVEHSAARQQSFWTRFSGRQLGLRAAGNMFAGPPDPLAAAAEAGLPGAPRALPATRLNGRMPIVDWTVPSGASPGVLCAAVWPGRLEAFWGLAAAYVGQHVDQERETAWPETWFLRLAEVDEPLVPAAVDALAVAMAAKARALRALVTDLLITTARDGRLDGVGLGQAVVQARRDLPNPGVLPGLANDRAANAEEVRQSKRLPLGRWLDHLESLAASGPQGRLASVEAFTVMALELDRFSGAEATRLLETWAQAAIALSAPIVEPAVQAALVAFAGSTRARKAANALLAQPSGEAHLVARRLVMDARLTRAERWLASPAAGDFAWSAPD